MSLRTILRATTLRRLTSTYPPKLHSIPINVELKPSVPITPPASQFSLRPYQDDCIASCLAALKSGKSRIAVSLATGGGKTVIFSNLIPLIPQNKETGASKVLILVHRRELAQQAHDTIKRFHPQYSVDIDMGESAASHEADVTIASVQTLTRSDRKRLGYYDPKDYKAIIVDECHHAVSPSYFSIFEYFDCFEAGGLPIIGFSATLKRHDKIPLGKVFQDVVYNKDLIDMIRENWLVDVTITPVYAAIGLRDVPVTKTGDYDLAYLGRYVNTEQVNELVLKTYLKFKIERNIKSTLFFCVNVEHLTELSKIFRMNGINCQYVTGMTKKLEREKLIEEFKTGQLDVLMNCGVFTEGTDIPNIDSVFIVRPTKSRPLLIQMIGRGLRLHTEKQKCHIVDFVDIADTGIELSPTLQGQSTKGRGFGFEDQRPLESSTLGPQDEIKTVQYTTYDSIHEYLQELKSTKDPDHIVMRKHSLPWVRVGKKSWAISISFSNYIRLDLNKNKQYELKQYHQGGKKFSYPSVLISRSMRLDTVLEKAESYVNEKRKVNHPLWSSAPITTKQLDFLQKKFMLSIENSKINPSEFEKLLKSKLQSFSKSIATELIFGYSVGGKYCLQEFIKERILPRKEVDKNRKLLL